MWQHQALFSTKQNQSMLAGLIEMATRKLLWNVKLPLYTIKTIELAVCQLGFIVNISLVYAESLLTTQYRINQTKPKLINNIIVDKYSVLTSFCCCYIKFSVVRSGLNTRNNCLYKSSGRSEFELALLKHCRLLSWRSRKTNKYVFLLGPKLPLCTKHLTRKTRWARALSMPKVFFTLVIYLSHSTKAGNYISHNIISK